MSGSPDYPMTDDEIRENITTAYHRCYYPPAFFRQMCAILASGDRSKDLRTIATPSLIVHGAKDPLVPLAGGKATAKAIPQSRLEIIPGMGHNMPRQLCQIKVPRKTYQNCKTEVKPH